MTMYGLDASQIKKIVTEKMNTNPDLKYYINNDYLDEMIFLIIEGVCEAIEKNNKKLVEDIMK